MPILEEKIKKNKDAFDVYEPSANHIDKFKSRLGALAEDQVKQPVAFRFNFRIAAVVVLLLGVSFVLLFVIPPSRFAQASVQELAELTEVRNYYEGVEQERITELESLANDDSEKAALKELAEDEILELKANAVQLEAEYSQSKDERVFSALVNNYRLIETVLSTIIENINNVKSQDVFTQNTNES